MARVIAIMNQKGGVGKTTTTLNLGAALAKSGKRVLLVDLDPQANLTIGLGKRAADLSESVYELLTDPKADALKYAVHTNWERLDLIPSHIDLSGAEIEMVTMIGRETRLSKSLDKAREQYDYILIDCLPSLSLLTVNAMAAAAEVFVPLQAHPFALEGLGKLFEVVGMIREAMNPALKVAGVLVTMFDSRTNVSKVTLETLRRDERLREHIFTTTIKQNIKVAESQKDGVPVIYYDTSCHATKAYLALCEEVLEMENGVLASVAAERITEREKKSGKRHRTFTPDLIAPETSAYGSKSEEPGSDDSPAGEIPATPENHASPVAALVQEPRAPETESASPEIADSEPSATDTSASTADEPSTGAAAESEPAVVPPPQRNSADVESLHPNLGVPVAGREPALRASASSVEDENYRPRLNLKPGSCKIQLPE